MRVLGIDAGGTRTVCVLADEGLVISEARGAGANLQSAGELDVEKALHEVIERCVGAHPFPEAICLGMAGVDRPGDAEVVRGILTRIGGRALVLVVNDALIALEAGLPGLPGTVIVAGTGSIAYGRDTSGHAARAGGWGYVLGDEGSGYWLGRLALRAVVRAADGRGAATMLTSRILDHFGVDRPQDLVRKIYVGGARPAAIAALARHVGTAAEAGDRIAAHLIQVAAQELAGAAASVARRLGIEGEPVLLAGGTLLGMARLRAQVTEELGQRLPEAPVTPLTIEPAMGAASLAHALLSGSFTLPVYQDGL